MLQRLNKGGLIKSVRGPGGGYKLNCVPSFIADMVNELSRAFLRYLASRTLADFASYYASGRDVSIEISVITPSLGQKHPNFGHIAK